MAKIVPGILTNNEEEYHKRLRMAEHVSDLIQIDVVDGLFSKNTTVGVDIIKKFPSSSSLEVQLMVEFPQNYINDLARCDFVTRIIFPFFLNKDCCSIAGFMTSSRLWRFLKSLAFNSNISKFASLAKA